MEIIIHRINNLSKLKYIPKNYGVEIDVRNFNNDLILNHDPFKNGEKLERFLRYYKHGTLIVNIKSEYNSSTHFRDFLHIADTRCSTCGSCRSTRPCGSRRAPCTLRPRSGRHTRAAAARPPARMPAQRRSLSSMRSSRATRRGAR